jgi:hypothetical protein
MALQVGKHALFLRALEIHQHLQYQQIEKAGDVEEIPKH